MSGQHAKKSTNTAAWPVHFHEFLQHTARPAFIKNDIVKSVLPVF